MAIHKVKEHNPINVQATEALKQVRKTVFAQLVVPMFLGLLATCFFEPLSIYVRILLIVVCSAIFYGIISWIRFFYNSGATSYSGSNYDENIQMSTGFFCTSVVPEVLEDFSEWFEGDILEKFSRLISKRINEPGYGECRLMIFTDENRPQALSKITFFDGGNARKVAKIHNNVGMDIAYLTLDKLRKLCSDLKWIKWSNVEELDFAVYEAASDPIVEAGKAKKGVTGLKKLLSALSEFKISQVEYGCIQDAQQKNNYIQLANKLKAELYQNNKLKHEYDFYQFLFPH